jgi:class 3 adenylate cyclase
MTVEPAPSDRAPAGDDPEAARALRHYRLNVVQVPRARLIGHALLIVAVPIHNRFILGGSQTRMDYTVIGDNVNVTSRIESNARAGEVYVSESTYLEVKDHIEASRLDPIKVKNRVQPVQVYAVRMPGPAGA